MSDFRNRLSAARGESELKSTYEKWVTSNAGEPGGWVWDVSGMPDLAKSIADFLELAARRYLNNGWVQARPEHPGPDQSSGVGIVRTDQNFYYLNGYRARPEVVEAWQAHGTPVKYIRAVWRRDATADSTEINEDYCILSDGRVSCGNFYLDRCLDYLNEAMVQFAVRNRL